DVGEDDGPGSVGGGFKALDFSAAGEDGGRIGGGLVDDGGVGDAAVLGCESESVGEGVGAGRDEDGDGVVGLGGSELAGGLARAFERCEGFVLGAGGGVVAFWRNVDRCGGRVQCEKNDEQRTDGN